MLYLILAALGLIAVYFLFFRKGNSTPSAKVLLQGHKNWVPVTLIDVKSISPDTRIFTFGFPSADLELGLPVGSHVLFSAKIPTESNPSGELVVRQYTPTSKINEKGKVEFPIKIYFKNTHPAYPNGGLMTQYLDSLKIGNELLISGPKGRLRYLGKGYFTIGQEKAFRVSKLGLVAGGTGITPCFQLIQYIIEHENNSIEMYLIYANKHEIDILLKERLEAYEATGRLKVFYTLDNPPSYWTHGAGFISEEMVKKHLPAPESCLVCHCGPAPMNNLVAKHLQSLGHTRTFRF